jgi:hypothetical protein
MQQDDHTVCRNKQVQNKERIALKTRLTEGDTFGILSVNRRHDASSAMGSISRLPGSLSS